MKPMEIKAARARLGYTQCYVAEALGMPASTYSAKENGKINFTTEQKIALGDVLGFNPVQLNEFLFDGKLPIRE